MVRVCRICNLSSTENKDLAFHRYPKHLEKRQKWASALGVQYIGKWDYVCRNHFTSDSYIFSNARQILKPDAIPFVIQSSDDEFCSPIKCTSESDNYPHVNAVHSTGKILDNIVIQNSDDESCSPMKCTSVSDNYPHVNAVHSTEKILDNIVIQSSDDESCSPIKCTSASDDYPQVNAVHSTKKILNNIVSYRTPRLKKIKVTCNVTTPKTCPKIKVIWNSNRFGDLSAKNFETPNCAARNVQVLKTTITQLRKKNKNLYQKYKRLEEKVKTLNDQLNILKTDFATDNLKVHQIKQ